MELTLTAPQIEQQALTLVQQAQAVQVTDQATLTEASSARVRLKNALKTTAEFFDPLGKKLDAAKAEFLSGRRRVETPLKEAVAYLDEQMSGYHEAERLKRQQEEARLNEAAKVRNDTARLEQASSLERLGQSVAAEQVLTQPIVQPPITLPKPTMVGTTMRTDWKFTIENAALLPREYLMPDEVKIGQVVRALKVPNPMPGVAAFPKTVPISSRVVA